MESLAHLQQMAHRMPVEARARVRRATDIATRAERAPGAGDDQDADFIIVPRRIDRSEQILEHRLAVTIHPLWTIDGDLRDVVLYVEENRFEFHLRAFVSLWLATLFA